MRGGQRDRQRQRKTDRVINGMRGIEAER